MKIHLLFVLFIIFSFAILIFLYVNVEKGAAPSEAELRKFNSLHYFKNGRFFNYYKTIDGFKNSNEEENSQNPSMFNIFLGLIKPAKKKVNKVFLDKSSFSKIPDEFSLYWLGHAMVILEIQHKRILIDPVFGNASPFPFVVGRYTSAPVKINDLPKIDYVLITHNHYDHLERKTIQKLNKDEDLHFIIPLGVGSTLKKWGVGDKNIIELGWGDDLKLSNDLKITAEPAIHFSGRWLNDQGKTLWNSYVIQSGEINIFCAGDGAYGEQIDLIAEKYKHFNLVMIESDAWNIRWPYFHMFTRESMEVVKKLNAKYLLPVHWGVFNLAMHKFYTSVKMLKKEAYNYDFYNRLLLPAMGEKVVFKSGNYNADYKNHSI